MIVFVIVDISSELTDLVFCKHSATTGYESIEDYRTKLNIVVVCRSLLCRNSKKMKMATAAEAFLQHEKTVHCYCELIQRENTRLNKKTREIS